MPNAQGQERKPQIVAISGAGSGIGQALALHFAQQNWQVILIGRRLEALQTTASLCREIVSSAKLLCCPLDLSSADAQSQAENWLRQNGILSLDALINNAGQFVRGDTLSADLADWMRMFEVNTLGPLRLTRACYPLLKINRGAILNISSTLGLKATVDTVAYSASKAALNNWAQAFAVQAARDGVRVNTICPGLVDTPIHGFHKAADKAQTLEQLRNLQPLGRIGRPEDLTSLAFALCSAGSEWTTGAVVNIDGGIHLV
ncbi:MAG TPA: SDR family oxidoreductase [Pseudobdellovibrionaceae bacterium]|nr:SDR family oxidoreductase [Pseudobdellovibrionaceae bacterium]